MEKRKDAQIFVLCHKSVNYNIPNNSLYTPIQCGADLQNDDLYEVRDNIGDDNLSKLNPFYLETSGTYWIWKNKISSYKYIGQCQYRRQLIFDEKFNFDSLFKNYDFVASAYIFPINLYQQYKVCHNIDDLNLIGDIVKDKFPEYTDAWQKMLNMNLIYYSAGFVLKSEFYDLYCKFLFGLLDEFRNRLDLDDIESVRGYVANNIKFGRYSPRITTNNLDYQCRIGGYLAERIFTAFAVKHFSKPNIMNYTKYEGV